MCLNWALKALNAAGRASDHGKQRKNSTCKHIPTLRLNQRDRWECEINIYQHEIKGDCKPPWTALLVYDSLCHAEMAQAAPQTCSVHTCRPWLSTKAAIPGTQRHFIRRYLLIPSVKAARDWRASPATHDKLLLGHQNKSEQVSSGRSYLGGSESSNEMNVIPISYSELYQKLKTCKMILLLPG